MVRLSLEGGRLISEDVNRSKKEGGLMKKVVVEESRRLVVNLARFASAPARDLKTTSHLPAPLSIQARQLRSSQQQIWTLMMAKRIVLSI